MKYLTTIFDINNVNLLAEVADGFVVGNDLFSTRLTTSFSAEQINEISLVASLYNKELFINFNQMMDDELLNKLTMFISKLKLSNITGFIVADIGAFEVLKNLKISKIIYHPETLLTNSFDFNFMHQFGGYGAFVAKEITIDDIIQIGEHKTYKLFYNGHGYLNMFYSRRRLLDHYQTYLDEEHTFEKRQDLKLLEERRPDLPYPVLQDQAGTHVFRSKIFSAFKEIEKLASVVDYFYLDSIFESDLYAYQVLKMYKEKTFDQIPQLEEEFNQQWDDGFLYKKTLYQVKK